MANSLLPLATTAISTLTYENNGMLSLDPVYHTIDCATANASITLPTTTTVAMYCDDTTVNAQTIQAVNYVESYNQEEIDDLLSQVNSQLEGYDITIEDNQDVYVKRLKK